MRRQSGVRKSCKSNPAEKRSATPVDFPKSKMPEPSDESEALTFRLSALAGLPLVESGDDLATIIVSGLAANGERLRNGDVIVLAQKIVSKAQGRAVPLSSVVASERAAELAKEVNKDPRLVELILRESTEVVRHRRDVLIVGHRLGFVLANAGIDFSNVAQGAGDDIALLLPEDPDGTCAQLRAALRKRTGADVAIVINDSHGRPFRNGTVGTAIGASGFAALADLRGQPDLFGRRLQSSEVALADEIAAAASLLMGQAGEGRPIVLVRGIPISHLDGGATDLVRIEELTCSVSRPRIRRVLLRRFCGPAALSGVIHPNRLLRTPWRKFFTPQPGRRRPTTVSPGVSRWFKLGLRRNGSRARWASGCARTARATATPPI